MRAAREDEEGGVGVGALGEPCDLKLESGGLSPHTTPMRRNLVCILAVLGGILHAQDVVLSGLTDGNFRYQDIGGQPYSAALTSSYSYASAQVTLSLDTPGLNHLAGLVTATGLKPNFAYQIKITGNPSRLGLTDADDAANEIIGYRGRWWRIQPNPANSNDADYNAHKDDPTYIYEGYLLIAFFVTDSQGNASVRFTGNNSYHVLWRTDQRQPTANDGPLLSVTVPDTTGNAAYDSAVPARQYELYGEWEPTRALPGALELPDGHYRARLFLTEESFHDYGPQGGMWAVAMSGAVEFDIPTTVGPSPQPPPGSTLPLTITRLRGIVNFASPHRDFLWLTGTLELPAALKLDSLEVRAEALGAARLFTLGRRGRSWLRDGILELRRAGTDTNFQQFGNSLSVPATTASFRLRMSHATLQVPPNAAETVSVGVTLSLGGEEYAGAVAVQVRIGGTGGALRYGDR